MSESLSHPDPIKDARRGESGNMLFYILAAIVLLAALCYAVAQGGNGSFDSMTSNKTHLTATGLIDYADSVGKAVQRLRLRGSAVSALSFANPALADASYGTYGDAPDSEIFNPAGGALIYKRAPAEATTTGTEDYLFLSGDAIKNIGTTCTEESCADLVMALPNVQKPVCIELNKMLQVGNPGAEPPSDTAFDDEATFKGTFEDTPKVIGNTAPGAALAGKSEGCLAVSATEYLYYKVLVAR
jgi:hypothetical protein